MLDFRGYAVTMAVKAVMRRLIDPRKLSRMDAKNVRSMVIERQDGKCMVCACHCAPIAAIHHVQSVREGGTGNDENLIALCPNCHAVVTHIERNRTMLISLMAYQTPHEGKASARCLGMLLFMGWILEHYDISQGNTLYALGFGVAVLRDGAIVLKENE